MATTVNSDELIPQRELEAVDYLIKGTETLYGNILKLVDESKKVRIGSFDDKSLMGAATAANKQKKATDELTLAIKEYETVSKQNAITQARLSVIESDESKQLIVNRKALADKKKELEALNNEYKKLTNETNKAAEAAKNAIAGEVRAGKAIHEWSEETKYLVANSQKLQLQLKGVDAVTLDFRRNVGNYNHVGVEFNRLLQEAPAFAYSTQTGILGLSNNIPMFTQAVQDALKAGQSWGQIMKNLGAQLISPVGLMTIGVSVLTIWGDKLFATSEKTDELAEANKRYVDSLKGIDDAANKSAADELSRLRILEAVATDETATREKRNDAAQKMLDMYPNMLHGYDQEAIKAGAAANAINTLAEAILKKAVADAASNKYAASFLNQIELADKLNKAQVAFDEAAADYWSAVSAFQDGEEVDNFTGIQSKKAKAEKYLAEVTAAYKGAAKEAYNYKNIAKQAVEDVPDLFDKDKKTGAGKKDKTKELKDETDAIKEFLNTLTEVSDKEIEEAERWIKEYSKSIGEGYYETEEFLTWKLNFQTDVAKKEERNEQDRADKVKKIKDAELEDEKKRQRAYEELRQLAYQYTITFSKNASNKRIQDIDDTEAANQRAFQNEIDRLQFSTLTQEEKYNKLADLQVKAEISRQDAENRKKIEQQKQVEFERQIALAMVAFELIKGLAKEVGSKGVAGLATGAAITAYVTALSGALAAVTTPNYYEFGTPIGGHKGGDAVVGEGKSSIGWKPEFVEYPNGNSFWVTSPTYIPDMPVGTEVTPIDKMSNTMISPKMKQPQQDAIGINTMAIVNAAMNGVTTAISKQPRYSTNVTGRGIIYMSENGNSKKQSINKGF